MMLILWILAYTALFVIGALALLMPFFVYRMKKQMNKMEESIEEIKTDLNTLIAISTHVSKEITDKDKK